MRRKIAVVVGLVVVELALTLLVAWWAAPSDPPQRKGLLAYRTSWLDRVRKAVGW
jgi:hypothetical protein